MIKILFWDIDGTVLNFEEAEKAAIRKGFARFHMGECTDAMLEQYSKINQKYWKILERGEMTKPEILRRRFYEFFEKYGLDPTLAEDFNTNYQEDLGDTICFNDHAFELIHRLKGKYKQYAVTNGTAVAQHKKLRLSGLDQVFDDIFISEEIGFEKPSKNYFDAVFKRIDIDPISPTEILIIGDSLTSDMAGGINAGLTTCWYNRKHEIAPDNVRIDYQITHLDEILEILSTN